MVFKLNGKYFSGSNVVWLKDGVLHKTTGPAVERVDGSSLWFVNGNEIPNEWIAENIKNTKDVNKEEQVLLKLTWS